jgi:hypothetical protein
LTAGQVESYLKENQRSAASLLAAFRTTGEQALLEEAMQKFPNDPQVAFEAAFKKDGSPEEQRQWFDALKQSAPQNALGYYLSALNYFKSGQPDQAVQDLISASSNRNFRITPWSAFRMTRKPIGRPDIRWQRPKRFRRPSCCCRNSRR